MVAHNLAVTSVLVLVSMSTAQTTVCTAKQSSYLSSASDWPKPTGDLSSFIDSYSSAHNGMFSGCSEFTNDLPSSLSTPYQEWVTSVDQWSSSFESMVSSAGSTCQALVAPVVIALPQCPDSSFAAVTTGNSGSNPTAASAGSSASVQASSTAASESSSTISLSLGFNPLVFGVMVCASIAGPFFVTA